MVPPSVIAVLANETSHARMPGAVAPAVAVIGIVVPFGWPHADPDTDRLPPHCAKKIPEMMPSVWFVTRHSKFPQVFPTGADTVLDFHVPTYNDDVDEVVALGASASLC
jgi:hypothetical protein